MPRKSAQQGSGVTVQVLSEALMWDSEQMGDTRLIGSPPTKRVKTWMEQEHKGKEAPQQHCCPLYHILLPSGSSSPQVQQTSEVGSQLILSSFSCFSHVFYQKEQGKTGIIYILYDIQEERSELQMLPLHEAVGDSALSMTANGILFLLFFFFLQFYPF